MTTTTATSDLPSLSTNGIPNTLSSCASSFSSAEHLRIIRLPLHLFDNLTTTTTHNDDDDSNDDCVSCSYKVNNYIKNAIPTHTENDSLLSDTIKCMNSTTTKYDNNNNNNNNNNTNNSRENNDKIPVHNKDDTTSSLISLRKNIVMKLQVYLSSLLCSKSLPTTTGGGGSGNGRGVVSSTSTAGVTVGSLLRIPVITLLRILDPLLTYSYVTY
jgi:hypothetical protein